MLDTNLPSDCTQDQIDGPADPFDGMSHGDIYDLLTEKQRDQIRTRFYDYLDKMNFASEIEQSYPDLTTKAQKVAAFAIVAWERTRDQRIDELIENGQIEPPK